LECVKKTKTQQAVTSDDLLDRAKDAWLRQLQQVPRLSEVMARNVVRHCPTALSLWQAYQEGNEGRNAALLADILNGTTRQIKLSEALHRFMTCENPKDMIFWTWASLEFQLLLKGVCGITVSHLNFPLLFVLTSGWHVAWQVKQDEASLILVSTHDFEISRS
jgi:hypothetical protein